MELVLGNDIFGDYGQGHFHKIIPKDTNNILDKGDGLGGKYERVVRVV